MAFNGFPKEGVEFLSGLRENNDKSWFAQHKELHEKYIMAPSREFVMAMAERLRTIAPRVNADPRVNKSLFKIHRDTRFSPDKTPFKTHVGIIMWEGSRPRMECSCFYFHVEPGRIYLGVGIYMFPKTHLETYRESVIHERYGTELVAAVNAIKQQGYEIHGEKYKRVPRGYDPEHPNAELLLQKGFHAGHSESLSARVHTPELLDFCFEHYSKLVPIHRWLVAMTERI